MKSICAVPVSSSSFWWRLLLLLLISSTMTLTVTMAQDRQCVTGYPMDNFCIERGTLLDNNRKATLLFADIHTIHCLVDVDWCVDSGYEVLTPPETPGEEFGRAFELDATGIELTLAEARRVGKCNTCDQGNRGEQRAGFQATYVGTVDPTYVGEPPLLLVEEIHPHTVDCASLLLPEKTTIARTSPYLRNAKLENHRPPVVVPQRDGVDPSSP
mmetsp:Transcript_21414/g.36482  ORF Transcript_21414/g.36482 Transcript_21414/m.36482 type:complete len:214 (-) Transcript_21414:1243-1884(-)